MVTMETEHQYSWLLGNDMRSGYINNYVSDFKRATKAGLWIGHLLWDGISESTHRADVEWHNDVEFTLTIGTYSVSTSINT